MENKPSALKVATSLTTVLALSVLAFLPFLAQKTYFADSEIWSVNLGYHFVEDFQNYWVFSRVVFYSLLALMTRLFTDPQAIFIAARGLMLVNIVVQVGLVFHIVKTHLNSRLANWLSVLLLVGNTFYLTQSFRIRSDMLATTLILATIVIYNRLKSRNESSWILLLGGLLAILTTPKVAFLLPVLILVYVADSTAPRKWQHLFICLLAGTLFYLACVFLRLGVLSDLILDLNRYLVNTVRGAGSGAVYLSAKTFVYVQKLVVENFWFVGIWLAPYFFSLKKTDIKWLSIHSYVLALLILAPEKYPFFICSLLPILCCSSTILLGRQFAKSKDRHSLRAVAYILAVLTIFGVSAYKIMTFMYSDLNKEQLVAMRSMAAYLDRFPEIRYYDVIGLVPPHSHLRHFAGPSQPETNFIVGNYIMQEAPDVIARVAKFDFFGEEMARYLEKEYINVGNGLFLRAFPVTGKLQKDFLSLERKESLANISPFFDKYKDQDLVFEALDPAGSHLVFTSIQNLILNRRDAKDLKVVKVSPFPMPEKLPPRNLRTLFRFDTEF